MNRDQIIELAVERMAMGSAKYGNFIPQEDNRELYQEMIDELLDCINYNIMQIQKLSVRVEPKRTDNFEIDWQNAESTCNSCGNTRKIHE